MRQDIAERWVAELRSGKYTQGRHVMKTPDGKMCCLAVLAEMAVAEGVIQEPELEQLSGLSGGAVRGIDEAYRYGASSKTVYVLPADVVEWAEMKTTSGEFFNIADGAGVTGFTSLAEQNDRGRDFGWIADMIEKYGSEL